MYTIFEGSDGRWRAYIPDESKKTGRRMITARTREELTARLQEHKRQQYRQDITLRQLLNDWCEYKALHVSQPTLDRMMRDWARYYDGSDIVDRPITAITKIDLDIWIHATIRRHKLTKHSYANFRAIINQMLDYAVDLGIIDRSPLSDLRINTAVVLTPEHKPADSSQVFSASELEKFTELAWSEYCECVHPKHRLVPLAALLLFYTGLRIGEVTALKWEDIQGDTLTIARFYRSRPYGEIVDHTKGRFGTRNVILIPPALEILREAEKYKTRSGYIFAARKNDLEAVMEAIRKKYYKYCRIIGCEKKSVHKARKTYISALLDGGVNINTVRAQAGHLNEITTYKNYVFDRSSDEEKRDKISAVFSKKDQKNPKKIEM